MDAFFLLLVKMVEAMLCFERIVKTKASRL